MARESYPVRKMISMSDEMAREIDEYRKALPGFPTEAEVLRKLLEMSLERIRTKPAKKKG